MIERSVDHWLAPRTVSIAGFLACAAMLAYALYAEHQLGFEPCPLCMFQRLGVLLLGVLFLVLALRPPQSVRGGRWRALSLIVVAAFPLYVSGRHVYIQNLPEGSVPSCGASLDYMLDVFPLATVVMKVLTGAGECQKIDWALWGLSMPAWVFLCSLLLVLVGVIAHWRVRSS